MRKYALRLLGLIVTGAALFALVFVAAVELTPFDASKLDNSSGPTQVYGSDGKLFATINAPGTDDLPYNDIPTVLQNAVVATEDHTFWNSSSIDIRGLLRAAFIDLWTQSLAQGGSTIQEQLAKIVYLNDKKTFTRKFQQIVLGVQINRYFTKQEILAMYLNRVFLGENSVGVEQAAMRYFSVDLRRHPSQLTLTQAALLAGLPQAPSAYDPLQYPAAALKRRNIVLDNMAKYGYITQQQAAADKKQPLGLHPSTQTSSTDAFATQPLFTQFLIDLAARNHILTREEILQGGLKIYTTVDPQVQNAVNSVFWNDANPGDFPPPMNGQQVEGGAVFIDPKTGGILGAAGSRQADYQATGLDRAFVQSQPGSSIKPVMEYGPAVESGQFGPNSILDNTPHNFGGYFPHNDDPNAPQKVTLQYALTTSQNVASVWLLQQIGLPTGTQFAENDGLQLTNYDRTHLSVAIGGMEYGVSPFEMAQAYEAFDNQGVQMQAHLITRVVNQAGQPIYQYQMAAKRIMSAQTATTMTQIMQDVVQSPIGTGVMARVPGWPVAGKTGTVQYDVGITGSHPNWVSRVWFDGYTPNMVGSVYLGYDIPHDPQHHLMWSPYPGNYVAKIFADITQQSEAGKTPSQFPAPPLPAQPQPTQPQQQNPVSGLQASWDPATNAVQLNWQTALSGQANFQLSRQTNAVAPGSQGAPASQGQNLQGGPNSAGQATGSLVPLGQTSQTTYQDASVSPGSTYTYYVQAVDPNSGAAMGPAVSTTIRVPASALPSTGNNATGTLPDNGTGNVPGTSNIPGAGNVTGQGPSPGTGTGTGNQTGTAPTGSPTQNTTTSNTLLGQVLGTGHRKKK